jgi:Nucleotidyl transferase AbiEii toxin, Type IV TA system
MTAPSRATRAGQAYLDLRAKARNGRRPVDELLQLYVLESFLARLADSRFADQLILKGGVLLAAFGERRPTRDIDLQAHTLDNDVETVRVVICEIAARRLDDGVSFDADDATAAVIRDEDAYSGVRVTMTAELATARPHFHVDVNAGDPITPAPQELHLPRLLGGEVVVWGYPLAMVYAEKVVTAVARGTVNTRWRDFADIYPLSRRHGQAGADLASSLRQVAHHRHVALLPLSPGSSTATEKAGKRDGRRGEESSSWRTVFPVSSPRWSRRSSGSRTRSSPIPPAVSHGTRRAGRGQRLLVMVGEQCERET